LGLLKNVLKGVLSIDNDFAEPTIYLSFSPLNLHIRLLSHKRHVPTVMIVIVTQDYSKPIIYMTANLWYFQLQSSVIRLNSETNV
jgi:hypothetical protein